MPGRPLELVAGRGGLRKAVRWVHVSELEDPTPWLQGGELLLTTGMGVGRSPAGQRAYIARLVEAGISGLGFGTGFSFKKVPRGIADAAESSGFAVFEVPYETPFIAITELVYSRLAGEQIETLQRSMQLQQDLTRAVIDGQGIEGIARILARTLDGWVVVLGVRGEPLGASTAQAAARAVDIWERLREAHPDGGSFSLSVAERRGHVFVQPVRAHGHAEAYLAVGTRQPTSPSERIVAAHALSLIALELDKARAVEEAERSLRGDAIDALLDDGGDAPAPALSRFGFRRGAPVTGLAVAGAGIPAPEVRDALEAALRADATPFLTSVHDGAVLALVPADSVEAGSLSRRLSGAVGRPAQVGGGSDVPADQGGRSLREARYALRVCSLDGRSHAEFADLGTYRLLLAVRDPEALRAFADSVLSGLDDYDLRNRGELVASVDAFLQRNARWEQAAADLFVHRHTLRYRMRKVEQLTGRSLDSSQDRTEMWLALRARDVLAAEGTGPSAKAAVRPARGARGPVSPEARS
jgi:purine catabolism regulator